MRGPLVYCLESTDLPADVPFSEVIVPRNIQFTARFHPDLLRGLTVLKGQAMRVRQDTWSRTPFNAEQLYADLSDRPLTPVEITLMPYYAWNNRGRSEMSVWLPVDW